MIEKSVKKYYRQVRHCEQRPKRWGVSNRQGPTYNFQGTIVDLYTLEKVLLALKSTNVQTISASSTKDYLILSSSGYGFKYKLHIVEVKRKEVAGTYINNREEVR